MEFAMLVVDEDHNSQSKNLQKQFTFLVNNNCIYFFILFFLFSLLGVLI